MYLFVIIVFIVFIIEFFIDIYCIYTLKFYIYSI